MKGWIFFATVIATAFLVEEIHASKLFQRLLIIVFSVLAGVTLFSRFTWVVVRSFLDSFLVFIIIGCDCDYHPGGCTISWPAEVGYKCRCEYRGFWTCRATEIRCNSGEDCPGNCWTKECCEQGGGDCGGYD
jgi:hypothetical protein